MISRLKTPILVFGALVLGGFLLSFLVFSPVQASLESPDGNSCLASTATKHVLSTDAAAGFEWSSSVFAPASGGAVGIYFHNLGPGPITYAIPSFSQNGVGISSGTVSLTPNGSSASFWDRGWEGTFAEGVDWMGCINLTSIDIARGNQGTAHLDLTFTRDGTPHTVRVNVHLK